MDRGDLPDITQQLLKQLRTTHKKAYRLTWKGTKIPRGAKLDGEPIMWTQHGCVYTGQLTGEIVGYYTRTKEWGGGRTRRTRNDYSDQRRR